MRAGWFVLFAACGRIAFDPLGGKPGDAQGTGDGAGTGAMGDGAGSATGDAAADAANACARALVVTAGTRLTTSTCVGYDTFDGCGPASTQDVLFQFTPATSKSYNIAAYDQGSQNISNSTQRMSATCTTSMGSCAGLAGLPLTAGQTYYFMVEAAAGGCAMIDFSVM